WPADDDKHGDTDRAGRELQTEVTQDAAGEKREERDEERRHVGDEVAAKAIAEAENHAVSGGKPQYPPPRRAGFHEEAEHHYQRERQRRLRVVAQDQEIAEVHRRETQHDRAGGRERRIHAKTEDAVQRRDRRAEEHREERPERAPRDTKKTPGP